MDKHNTIAKQQHVNVVNLLEAIPKKESNTDTTASKPDIRMTWLPYPVSLPTAAHYSPLCCSQHPRMNSNMASIRLPRMPLQK